MRKKGFARFFENNLVQLLLSLLGGAMIIWMGIAMFRARTEVVERGKDLPYGAFTAGILTSILNPYFLLWWATIGSMLVMRFLAFDATGFLDSNAIRLAVFILVHWLCDLVWLSLVSTVVHKTHSLWGKRFQQGLFITCSLLLIGFGAWFVASGVRAMF